jgi:organic radical activating enzyme
VSPKAGAPLRLTAGDELKVVVPQPGIDLEVLEELAFGRFAVQPMDGPEVAANMRLAVDICMRRPRWQLSLQTHKLLGIR